ncbi:MAG TPA: hypothetical protein VEA58_02830 [Anaerovoracaceae bacterium]|nr:hypothetical protein [Anaerovoracaceae bacterium]
MKYIITAKNIRNGNDHITDPLSRTEICTELIMPRLKAIELLKSGRVGRTDTIVTRIDRKCLYDSIWDSVMDWSEFESIQGGIPSDDIVDLVKDIYLLDVEMPFKPFYQRYEQDKEEIHKVTLSDLAGLDLSQPFIAVLIRRTPNHPEKNLPDQFWSDFIYEFCDSTLHKTKVFVFGEVPHHLREYRNVAYIERFKDWCSVLNNSNCRMVVSTCTGGVYPIFFTGHSSSRLLIIDNNNLIEKHGDSPSFYNNCINFTKATVNKIPYIPKPKRLVSKVIDYASI